MTPSEAVKRLNNEAKTWRLCVGRNGDDITFYVVGTVLPTGKQRGALLFDGIAHPDARIALVDGVFAMERRGEIE